VLIISKKRILFVTIMIMVSVMSFEIFKESENTIETVTLPVTGKTIVLDAGHGLPDEGAESSNGVTEASINLAITKKVQTLLEQSGCNVVLTR